MCFDSANKPAQSPEQMESQIPAQIQEQEIPVLTREGTLQKAIDAYVNVAQPNGEPGILRMLQSLAVLEGKVLSLRRSVSIARREWLATLRVQHPEMVNEAGDGLASSYFKD